MTRVLEVRRLGRVSYARGLELQAQQVRRVREGSASETLFLLEHPHVITLGSGSSPSHVLAEPEELQRRGVAVHEAGRGGDVTYHGPGQLVGYPILDLKPDRKDLHRYLRDLEGVLIEALAALGLDGERVPGLTGVWVGGEKVAAIGIRVSSGWISSHGFALNVSTDLSFFETIVPCGIADRRVTSLTGLLGATPARERVEREVIAAFCRRFGYRAIEAGGAAVGRPGAQEGSTSPGGRNS